MTHIYLMKRYHTKLILSKYYPYKYSPGHSLVYSTIMSKMYIKARIGTLYFIQKMSYYVWDEFCKKNVVFAIFRNFLWTIFFKPMLTLFLDQSCLELTRIERSCNEGLLFASKHYTAGLRLKALFSILLLLVRLKNVMPKM